MPDTEKLLSTCFQLQQRIADLEHQLVFRNGQCAQAVAALIQVMSLSEQIVNDPATSEQSVMDAVRMRFCASSVIGLFADERGSAGHSEILLDAMEVARNLLASSAPSSTALN